MLSPSHQHQQQQQQRTIDNGAPYYYAATPTAITTSAAAPAYYSYNSNTSPLYYPVPPPSGVPSKRIRIDTRQIPSTYDCPALIYHHNNMTQAAVPSPRSVVAPHISLQRPSEPASPVTIASSLSNESSPSPSPSTVRILSDNSPNPDFALFDDSFGLPDTQKKHNIPRRLYPAATSNPPPQSHFTGIFSNIDPAWAHYFPQSVDQMKLQQQQQQQPQQQQQQYIQDMSANNYSQQHRSSDDDDVPALSPARATQLSVSSTRPSDKDMPTTPVQEDATASAIQHRSQVPKLARTVSDAVQDELFNPGIAPGTTHSQSDSSHESSATSSKLPTLFQQAQSQHAMARTTPTKPYMRDNSPFRANSPFHPARTQQEATQAPTRTSAFLNVGGYQSARIRREKEKEREAEALRNQIQKDMESMQEPPTTISPKDAYIEYHEPEGDGVRGSLFGSSQLQDDAQSQNSSANGDAISGSGSYTGSINEDDEDSQTEQSFGSVTTSRRESESQMGYGGIAAFQANNAQHYGQNISVPTYWIGAQDQQNGYRPTDQSVEAPPQRPEDTRANDAAYTCTVRGCTQRFPTASKMSKHRREVHRHGTPMNRDAPIKSLLQGPSRCARINPTTGKPCNTVFSRPYDLTRHEDTIHNTARTKVRCEICNDEKTFSRADALTRHKKVKHGIDK